MPDLQFYTTEGCRLCDEAFLMLKPIAKRKGLAVQCIDVMEDPAAEAHYADAIPVIESARRPHALRWPFTAEDIYRWLI